MITLVLGATGATGRHLLAQLLERGHHVRVIVRRASRLPETLRGNDRLEVVDASLLELDDAALASQVRGCDAVASCLGHNITAKGIWGKPRRLVTDAVKRLCAAIRANRPERPVRFVLMNTVAVRDPDVDPPRSFRDRLVFAFLRLVLPPHVDNERAVGAIRTIGPDDPHIAWCAVRPSGLVEADEVSDYQVEALLDRSPIFEDRKVSRINVAHFMAGLCIDDGTWSRWKGRMPVIANNTDV